MAEMTAQDRHDLEKYRDTERRRERARQIAAQAALGPVKTAREIEIASLDLFESLWETGHGGT